MQRIDISLFPQRGSNDCLIACVMMILEWAKANYPEVASYSYDALVKILGMTATGTKFCDVTNLNKDRRNKECKVQLEFGCAPTSLHFVIEQIQQGLPVIVYLLQEHYDNKVQHAVVVNFISTDKTKIGILDPLRPKPINKSTGAFLEEWEQLLKYTIYVKINEIEDLTLYLGDDSE